MELEFNQANTNLINLPGADTSKNLENIPTPKFDKIYERANKLQQLSSYKSSFDFDTYKNLEMRFHDKRFFGGVIYKSPFKVANFHPACQQCLYAFELDTYGRGCTHDCVYCYAKAELTVHGMWNSPFPAPIDITEVWNTFYTVFETSKRSKWRDILEKRIPIRIGSMSDSFMPQERKYKVTLEALKILNYYKYPYIIFTRSDMISADEYLNVFDPELCSIQMSIASTNDEMNKLMEPGTPNAKRRLRALGEVTRAGIWTTARINPFFPIYADGYFSDPEFDKKNMPEPFHFSSFEMVDEIASYGIPSVLAGMVRLSKISMNQIEKATGRNLRELYNNEKRNAVSSEKGGLKSRDFHFSDEESRAYYERIQAKCIQNGIQFSTCYIGNGEKQFWRDQDLWSNKSDCCNVKGKVGAFNTDSRDIEWEKRLKFTSDKYLLPVSPETLHKPLVQPLLISEDGVKLNPELINENNETRH